MRLTNLLHECIHSLLKRPAVQRASKVITSHILLACTLLVVLWKRVAVTFVEVSLVLGFCCWLTPITLTVLCVSTCSDGLLDFHTFGFSIKKVWPSNGSFLFVQDLHFSQRFAVFFFVSAKSRDLRKHMIG